MISMNNHPAPDGSTILVTGATGYIGGRLVPRLLDAGYRVRCIVRDQRKLQHRPWSTHAHVQVVEVDITDTDRLALAMHGCDAAYYLVHSMIAAGSQYARIDRHLAQSFAHAAARANLMRIIYLGGLGETGQDLSEHLASRRDVEDALASTNIPVTTLRAAMIIGSGSASFEILRYLVERLPIMITPRWVSQECQPIAVENVLTYLVDSLDQPETIGRAIDIGGPEVLTYRDLMQIMARERGLTKRIIIPVPVLTPRLSSLWIHLVTPVSSKIARPLAEGLRNRVVCRNDDAHRLMPQRLFTVRESIVQAVREQSSSSVTTMWSDAGRMPGDPDWAGGTTFVDRRQIHVRAEAESIFKAICRVGGGNGYYAGDALWRLRGWMDRLIGGPGLRRGRRHPEEIGYGDALDFWRVTAIDRNRHLELRAEMKLPGVATLEFNIEPDERKVPCCKLTQTARFRPRGLVGILYWYVVLPLHGFVFRGMLNGVRQAAEGEDVAKSSTKHRRVDSLQQAS